MFLSRSAQAVVVVSFLSVAGGFAVEQPANASGTVTVNGKATALHHAYARHDQSLKGTLVLITDRAIDAAMLAEESSGFSSGATPSLRDLTKKGEVSGVELLVNESNQVEMAEVYNKAFDNPTPFSGRYDFWYEPYRLSIGWIGGRSRSRQPETFFKRVWEYEVTFLTTVGQKGFEIVNVAALDAQHKANDAREKQRAVAPGGGDEGAMYLAYRHNVEASNGKAILEQMTASMKSAIVDTMHTSAPLNEATAGSWAFMTAVRAGKVEVVGGVRDADSTTLELMKTATADGTKTFGTAKLVKEKGVWKIADETWR
jgi:hypothetical protein